MKTTLPYRPALVHGIVLSFFFVAINGYFFYRYGVKIVNDSTRYLNYAELIRREGIFFQSHNFWYVGYVVFIVFAKFFYPENISIIFFQLVFHALSVCAL